MKYKVGDRVRILSLDKLRELKYNEEVLIDPSIYEIAETVHTITKVYEEGFYLVNDYPLALSWRVFAETQEMGG